MHHHFVCTHKNCHFCDQKGAGYTKTNKQTNTQYQSQQMQQNEMKASSHLKIKSTHTDCCHRKFYIKKFIFIIMFKNIATFKLPVITAQYVKLFYKTIISTDIYYQSDFNKELLLNTSQCVMLWKICHLGISAHGPPWAPIIVFHCVFLPWTLWQSLAVLTGSNYNASWSYATY